MTERNNGYYSADDHLPYKVEYQTLISELTHGEELPSYLAVGYVLNRNLKPNALALKQNDKSPFVGIQMPGKSAHILFPSTPQEFVEIVLERPYIPNRDHIFRITAGELNQMGFHALWAPLQRCPLHVRVVHESAFGIKDPQSYQIDERVREELVSRLIKNSPLPVEA